MNPSFRMFFIILVGLALAWSPQAAQPDPDSPALMNLEFPGGTIAEYVEALRKAAGEANIVVRGKAVGVRVPPMQLKSVTLGSALELIQGIFQTDEQTQIKIGVKAIDRYNRAFSGTTFSSSNEGDMLIYCVTATVHREPRGMAQVWTIADLLTDEQAPEAVLTAVETTVGLLTGQYEPAEIRFHEATGLLIARGHREQLEAIEQVVDQLRESVDRRRETEHEGDEAQELAELEEQLRHRDLDMERIQLRSEQAELAEERNHFLEENRRLEATVRELERRLSEIERK